MQLFIGRKQTNKQKTSLIQVIQHSLPWNLPTQFSAFLFLFQYQPLQRQKKKCHFKTSSAIPFFNTIHYQILSQSEIQLFMLCQHIVNTYEKVSLKFKQHGTSERKKSLRQKINKLHLLLKCFNSTPRFICLLITTEMDSAINTISGLMKAMAH